MGSAYKLAFPNGGRAVDSDAPIRDVLVPSLDRRMSLWLCGPAAWLAQCTASSYPGSGTLLLDNGSSARSAVAFSAEGAVVC